MTRLEQLDGIERLAAMCKARGWKHRLRYLRADWRSVRDGADKSDWVASRLALWQMAPFENELDVRRLHAGCPHCRVADLYHRLHTTYFEERALHECNRCKRRWIELDEPNRHTLTGWQFDADEGGLVDAVTGLRAKGPCPGTIAFRVSPRRQSGGATTRTR